MELFVPLSRRRIKTYQQYYCVGLTSLWESDNGTKHPVVMFEERHADEAEGKQAWLHLMCPCDLEWRWMVHRGKRTLVHTRDGSNCPAKEHARESVRAQIRNKYRHEWNSMALTEAIHDVYKKHVAGEYLGEHSIGLLYVQDIERLLDISPCVTDLRVPEFKDEQGNVISPAHVEVLSYPNQSTLSSIRQLMKRKLLDLNGMILLPYKEYFRFPDCLHHQFAHWIEEWLGGTNGDAGDCFMSDLYEKIAATTGWTKGEDVFGERNIPECTPEIAEQLRVRWCGLLDARLSDDTIMRKDDVLTGLTIGQWVAWLKMIQVKLLGTAKNSK